MNMRESSDARHSDDLFHHVCHAIVIANSSACFAWQVNAALLKEAAIAAYQCLGASVLRALRVDCGFRTY